MNVSEGDVLIIRGRHTGQPMRRCRVLEVRGDEGPFLVRWEDTDHETLYFPGSDATVEAARGKRARRGSPAG
jgi:hypothetical protein